MSKIHHPIKYRADIDGLRAVAVTSVVLHHAFPDAFPGGFIGVDIFFVISGYLISSILLDDIGSGKFSFLDFYKRRILRIFPALLLVLAVVMIAGYLMLFSYEFRQLSKHVFAGSVFLSNIAFWREVGYFDGSAITKPLLHLWSLAVEEQFYIFWPLVLLGLSKLGSRLFVWVLLLLLASFVFNLWLVRTDVTAAFYNPLARFWEMMMGAGLAVIHHKKQRHAGEGPGDARYFNEVLSMLGLLLLALVLFKLNPERRFPGWWAFVGTAGTCLLIAGGSHAWVNRLILSSKPLVWIGLISYPLYLWHWPVMSFAYIEQNGAPAALVQWACVALSVLLAWFTYLMLEKPIRMSKGRQRNVYAVALSVLMLMTAGLSLALYKRDVMASGQPDLLRTLQTKGGTEAVTEGWRDKTCMLDFNVPPSQFQPFCIEDRRPLMFLWGDSHAASLYPGFKALQDSGRYAFGIAERTGAICPPVLGIEPRPACKSLNDEAISVLRRLVPDVVVLYAWWHEAKSYGRYDISGLEATVAEIRKAGVKKIVILGAVPYWQGDLPQILMKQWKDKGHFPLRLGAPYIDPHVYAATEEMRQRSAAMGVRFISGLDYFCNKEGCLTRLNRDATEPLSYDYGHLSVPASRYYVEQIAPLIFGN